jgi:hypothetical protein
VAFSDEERISGIPKLHHIEEALVALHRDGDFAFG